MSVRALSWAWRRQLGDRPGAKLLLAAIADQCGDEGVTYTGPKKLMTMTELSRTSFYRHRNDLIREGYLHVIERRRPSGTKTSNYFVLSMDTKAAHEYFEELRRDGLVQSNPIAPDGSVIPADCSTTEHTECSTTEQRSPMVEQRVSHHGTDLSHGGTDPSRVTDPLGDPLADPCPLPDERDPAAEAICQRVAQLVEQVDPGRTATITDDWHRSAHALLSEDGRDLDQVLAVIDWAAADTFWPPLLLSPADLRRHFPRVQAKRAAARTDIGRAEARHLREAERAGYCCGVAGSAPCEADEHWRAIGPQLEARIGAELFGVWFGDAHAHQGGGGELLIGVPEGVIGWVRDRFTGIIEQAAGRRVEVVVCTEAHP